MKMPSLNTMEGLAVLAAGAFVAYTVYKSYKAGQGMIESVKDTVGGVIDSANLLANKARTSITGGNFGVDDNQSEEETARLKRYENNAYQNDTSPTVSDQVTPWNAMGDFVSLGYDSTTESVPQMSSPSSLGIA